MVSGSIGPAISNSRVGKISGQDKFDALSLRGNSAGGSATSDAVDKKGKIKAGELVESKKKKDDAGEQAKEEGSGDKSKATTGTDSAQQKAIKDGTNKALSSRLEEMRNTPFPDESANTQPLPQQQQGMDPMMMAALANQGKQQSQAKPQSQQAKPSSNSSNKALENKMKEMNENFTGALKQRDAKIKELSNKQKGLEGRDTREPGGLGGERGLNQYKELATDLESDNGMVKGAARNYLEQKVTQSVHNQLQETPEGKATLKKIYDHYGGAKQFEVAAEKAQGKKESSRSETEVYKLDSNDQTAMEGYDQTNSMGDQLNLHNAMASSQRDSESLNFDRTEDLNTDDASGEEIADLDIDFEDDLNFEEVA